jgi:8-amino-7-oxononanoate synthase
VDAKPVIPSAVDEKRELARRLVLERERRRFNGTGNAAEPAGDSAPADLPPSHYNFDFHPQVMALLSRPPGAAKAYYHVHEGCAADTTVIAGRSYLNFASYNYLGLSEHPEIAAAVTDAVARYGSSVSASRMVGGERPIHAELERQLADLLDTDDCLAFVSGYSTNVVTLGFFFGPKDLILYDGLIHNSILMGATLSGARRIPFRHNDWQAVDDLLSRRRRDFERVVIVVEGLYSMDGDYPDLPRFVEIRNRHKVFLMVDEAHSIGVMGARGYGIREHYGLAGRDVDIWMGTLSKSLASCGGFIAGGRAVVGTLRYGAPGFIFSAGLTPSNTAAALTALKIMKREPERVQRAQARGRFFVDEARAAGLDVGNAAGYAVVPIIIGDTARCLAVTEGVFQRGLNVQPVIYPAVDERSARLRFFLTADHREDQIRDAIRITAEEWRKTAP